ncbi:dynamin family protein [Hokovirus HKV1]|uniref:Dynamin family protein n=1 Tax=Hokovirus HKV1 TaxID=1977638 RepID=A0A1V0SEZ2_9VIRU|nr:dynamin family protein [Hokovirus HKV1]
MNLLQLSTLYNIFTKDDIQLTLSKLSDSKTIMLANEINNIISDSNITGTDLSLPRLVVVGTQSSGKSSVLNSIITMDILPTGKLMTTRTPLELNLIKIPKNNASYVEFGNYDNEKWFQEKKITITVPIPTPNEITTIRNHIQDKTNEICGNNMNISNVPIILKIYSPNVPDLSLIDLPGLTMVACEDKGQPVDIKERIENLVSSYIIQPKTIIIAVMQARADLETDLGLALVKKYDKSGSRTIGVLTKPDLMNQDSHVGDYLLNKISKNLMLNYGYYLLKNRNDIQEIDILTGFKLETEYFNAHNEYKKSLYKPKLGINNLTNNLTKILVQSLNEAIPVSLTELTNLEIKVTQSLLKLGNDIPNSKEGKILVLNKYVTNFINKFIDSIESRGNPIFNAGKCIKDIFIKYRRDIMLIKPFTNSKIYNENYFNHVIASFEGNHMSCSTPPIQLLEACMLDLNLKPIKLLQGPSNNTLESICTVIVELIQTIFNSEEFIQYSQLATFITNKIIDDIIKIQKLVIIDRINNIILDEEAYIWTDNIDFKNILNSDKKDNNNYIIELLEMYYNTIKINVSNNVPKIIMNVMVKYIENNLMTYLFKIVVSDEKIELLKEEPEIEEQRLYYNNIKSRINNVKQLINKINE